MMTEISKKPDPIWLLAHEVSIVEAALLTLGIEPQGNSDSVEDAADIMLPKGYMAARDAIVGAISNGFVVGKLSQKQVEGAIGGKLTNFTRNDYHHSKVELESLREWLGKKGYHSSFLTPVAVRPSGFRDPGHPRYAPKLAAVVEAWEQFDENSKRPGTPKQKLVVWLRENASRFGLTNEDGYPSETAITELAKVANWETRGGAPKLEEEPEVGNK